MKNQLYYKCILIMALLMLCAGWVSAQCNTDSYTDRCNAKISDFTFLKNFKIDGARAVNGVLEFSYVFSKDTQYMITVCDGSDATPKVILTLYDSNRKEIASNYDKSTSRFLNGIIYKCAATGIYYITFKIEGGGSCSLSTLGFKK